MAFCCSPASCPSAFPGRGLPDEQITMAAVVLVMTHAAIVIRADAGSSLSRHTPLLAEWGDADAEDVCLEDAAAGRERQRQSKKRDMADGMPIRLLSFCFCFCFFLSSPLLFVLLTSSTALLCSAASTSPRSPSPSSSSSASGSIARLDQTRPAVDESSSLTRAVISFAVP